MRVSKRQEQFTHTHTQGCQEQGAVGMLVLPRQLSYLIMVTMQRIVEENVAWGREGMTEEEKWGKRGCGSVQLSDSCKVSLSLDSPFSDFLQDILIIDSCPQKSICSTAVDEEFSTTSLTLTDLCIRIIWCGWSFVSQCQT